MSRVMRKQAFCICENKVADQLSSNCTADQRLCFRYTDSTIPQIENVHPLAGSVCVGLVWKPHCWFSHDAAQMESCYGPPSVQGVTGLHKAYSIRRLYAILCVLFFFFFSNEFPKVANLCIHIQTFDSSNLAFSCTTVLAALLIRTVKVERVFRFNYNFP